MSSLEHYAGIRVMVTGANGFIGTHVAAALGRSGARVTQVVRTRRPDTDRAAVVADLADERAIAGLVAAERPEVIFNLAGYGVDPSERDEIPALALNTELPARLAEAMSRLDPGGWKGQHIVHAGSALEYGTATGDLAESTGGTPTTLYGRTKLAGTRKLLETSRARDLPSVTARLFTVYGPGEHAGRLLPSLLEAMSGRDPLPLTEGLQLRDFTYVDDAAEGLLRLGLCEQKDLGPVNVATGQLHTVREFVEIAADVLGIDARRLEFGALPTRAEEMKHDPVNVKRLEQLTGWKPSVSIRDGILRTSRARRG